MFGDSSRKPLLITPSDGKVHLSDQDVLEHVGTYYPRLLKRHPHVLGWWQVCIQWKEHCSVFRVFRNDQATVQCLRDLCVVAVMPEDEYLGFDLQDYLSDLMTVYRLGKANVSITTSWIRAMCRDCATIEDMYHRCWVHVMSLMHS